MEDATLSGPRGQTIRMLRAERGWNQKELAAAAGVSNLTIVRLENETGHPHAKTLHKVAEALGVSVRDLYEEPALAGKGEALRFSGRVDEVEREMLSAGRGLEMGRLFNLDNELSILSAQAQELEAQERASIEDRIKELRDLVWYYAEQVQERAQLQAAQLDEGRKARSA